MKFTPSGIPVGASLSVMQYLSHHVVTPELFVCDLCLGHAIYDKDRLLDKSESLSSSEVSLYSATTSTACLSSCILTSHLNHPECIPVILILFSYYKDIKKDIGVLKCLLIGMTWAYAIVCLPVVEEGYDVMTYFGLYGTMYASVSNLADVKDVHDDEEENVRTLPVTFGVRNAYICSVCFASVSLACAILIDDPFASVVDVCVMVYSITSLL